MISEFEASLLYRQSSRAKRETLSHEQTNKRKKNKLKKKIQIFKRAKPTLRNSKTKQTNKYKVGAVTFIGNIYESLGSSPSIGDRKY